MSVRVRYSLSIVALAGIWLTMLLWGGNPLDREIYEALYAGHRPMLAGIARALTFLGEPTVLIGAGGVCAFWLWGGGGGRVPGGPRALLVLGGGGSEGGGV